MGDRVSIKFVDGHEKSPILFSHWGGMGFVDDAKEYLEDLKAEALMKDPGGRQPLYRLEPSRVMLDFIRYLGEGQARILSDYYICSNENEGDDSDNGHHEIHCTDDAGTKRCMTCGLSIDIKDFRDELSLKEYTISKMCQACQDKVFNQ